MSKRPKLLLEPFAGGGVVSLTAVAERMVDNAIIVELDSGVAAVWQTIMSANANDLARLILNFDLTGENVSALLNQSPQTKLALAFQTIVRNRVLHGGIMAPGSGFIKHGENGKGLHSRWYPETLARRIMQAHELRDRIKVFHGDGVEILQAYSYRKTSVSFIDPPYTAGGKRAGTRLYAHCELDHHRLFDAASTLEGEFVMTYDNSTEVAEMALTRGFDIEQIPMKGTHHNVTNELIIGRDLSWARE